MIPFFDLAAQQAVIKSQIDENISKVLAHGKYILGPEVTELEERLCEYTGANHCITCANGTDALQIALMAIGVGPGDEVITPAFSYIATAEAAAILGAKPIYVDVDPVTFNIDPTLIEERISPRTKAIIPVSLYGQPANFQQINKIARKHNLIVIEDGAQSFGAEQLGQKSCNLSDIGCTSFFPTKPLGCYGDGGAIFTSDKNLAKSLRQIARHGQEQRYNHTIIGVNSRLDSIQAAILLAKLNILDEEIRNRNQLAEYYSHRLDNVSEFICPSINYRSISAWALYTLKCSERTKLIEKLTLAGVPSAIYYPKPLNMQIAVQDQLAFCPVSLQLSKDVLSIPIGAFQKDEITEVIVRALS